MNEFFLIRKIRWAAATHQYGALHLAIRRSFRRSFLVRPKNSVKITVFDVRAAKSYANCYMHAGETLQFDAHMAKLLKAGQHFTIPECPGLRLAATTLRRS